MRIARAGTTSSGISHPLRRYAAVFVSFSSESRREAARKNHIRAWTPSGGTAFPYVMIDDAETCLSCPLTAKTRVRTGIDPALAGSFAVPMEMMAKKHPEDFTRSRRNDSYGAIC